MIIYTKHITNRLIFVLDLIFSRMLHTQFTLVDEISNLPEKRIPLINYSFENIPGSYRILPNGLLFETGIRNPEIKVSHDSSGIPVLFEHNEDDLPFDIFSAVFYLVVRYEEYLPFKPDKHGRFPANASLAWKHSFLEIPVVNYWVKDLAQRLISFFPGLDMNPPSFQYQPTLDIDQAWAMKNKPFVRMAGGLLKDLMKNGWKNCKYRMDVLKGTSPDPFYTIPEWDTIHGRNAEKLKVFILAGKTSRYDLHLSTSDKNWLQMVKYIAARYKAGLHPSYCSNKKLSEIIKEKQLLETISGNPVYISRQHYIRLRLPETYRNLIKAGIREDYSMAYPEYAGFRAGIAFPFPFYDLEMDKCTDLIIFPFMLMDRTLKDYMQLDPGSAISKIEKLITAVKETGGLFISVWHNDSLSEYGEWNGWREIYLKMIELCKQ